MLDRAIAGCRTSRNINLKKARRPLFTELRAPLDCSCDRATLYFGLTTSFISTHLCAFSTGGQELVEHPHVHLAQGPLGPHRKQLVSIHVGNAGLGVIYWLGPL